MKKAHAYELPDRHLPHLRRAVRLQVITLVYMVSV